MFFFLLLFPAHENYCTKNWYRKVVIMSIIVYCFILRVSRIILQFLFLSLFWKQKKKLNENSSHLNWISCFSMTIHGFSLILFIFVFFNNSFVFIGHYRVFWHLRAYIWINHQKNTLNLFFKHIFSSAKCTTELIFFFFARSDHQFFSETPLVSVYSFY